MRKVCVIGSTGSIGTQTLDIIKHHKNEFKVVGLATGSNVKLLSKQIKEFSPKYVYISRGAEKIKGKFPKLKILTDEPDSSEGLEMMTSIDADIVVLGIPGFASLPPAISALKNGKTLALASKESILCASPILKSEEAKGGGKIIPVDSEHSALFRLISGYAKDANNIRRYIITASGGPFLERDYKELKNATPKNALKHPRWNMGKRITINSAILMNKAFEVIETSFLFDIPPEKIEVVIHPQALFHAFLETDDGVIFGLAHIPDMRIPISYALWYPEKPKIHFQTPSVLSFGKISIEEPDFEKFPSLRLGWDVLKMGGTAPCSLIAADEVAVDAFLEGKIKLADIYPIVKETLEKTTIEKHVTLKTIYSTYQEGLRISKEIVDKEL